MKPTTDDEVVMYLVIRTDLHMSLGKLFSQVGHGIQVALNLAEKDAAFGEWSAGSSTKVVLGVNSHKQLLEIFRASPRACLISDEGRTEIEPTDTLVSFAPMLKSEAAPLLGNLKLYKSPIIEALKKVILNLLRGRDLLLRQMAALRDGSAVPKEYPSVVEFDTLIQEAQAVIGVVGQANDPYRIAALFDVSLDDGLRVHRRLSGLPDPEPKPAPVRPPPIVRETPYRVLTDDQLAKVPLHGVLRLIEKVRSYGDDEYLERLRAAAAKLPHKDDVKPKKKASKSRLAGGSQAPRDARAKQASERA